MPAPLIGYVRWSSGQQREGVDVVWTYDGELTAIDSRELTDVQSLGRGHDGRVDGAERQVAVPGDQFSDAQPIGGTTGSTLNAPSARSPRKRTSGSGPRRVPSR